MLGIKLNRLAKGAPEPHILQGYSIGTGAPYTVPVK